MGVWKGRLDANDLLELCKGAIEPSGRGIHLTEQQVKRRELSSLRRCCRFGQRLGQDRFGLGKPAGLQCRLRAIGHALIEQHQQRD
jgi:hypothetical protein